jgi:DNA recombination protein RmuC
MAAWPTTLVSLLPSLRVGFRSLAIQKHSNEVWKVLVAVKTEFGKFGGILDKVSKELRETQDVLDDEVGVRRRAMDRKLRAMSIAGSRSDCRARTGGPRRPHRGGTKRYKAE